MCTDSLCKQQFGSSCVYCDMCYYTRRDSADPPLSEYFHDERPESYLASTSSTDKSRKQTSGFICFHCRSVRLPDRHKFIDATSKNFCFCPDCLLKTAAMASPSKVLRPSGRLLDEEVEKARQFLTENNSILLLLGGDRLMLPRWDDRRQRFERCGISSAQSILPAFVFTSAPSDFSSRVLCSCSFRSDPQVCLHTKLYSTDAIKKFLPSPPLDAEVVEYKGFVKEGQRVFFFPGSQTSVRKAGTKWFWVVWDSSRELWKCTKKRHGFFSFGKQGMICSCMAALREYLVSVGETALALHLQPVGDKRMGAEDAAE